MNFMDEEPYIEINFKCKKEGQKKLIKFILYFSNFTMKELAEVLEENISILHNVIKGKAYLSERAITNLTQLFYMFSSSCDFES
jgi:hypothetical protein